MAFGSTWLAPRIRRFIELYPDIAVSILVDEEELDLTMRAADVAIRMRPPRQPDLVQRHLMTARSHAFAAPEYIASHGMPEKPEDLAEHKLIIYGWDARPPLPDINWLVNAGAPAGREHTPILRLNNVYGISLAIRGGLGIGVLPDYMIADDTSLVRVLPEIEGPSFDMYFVYPEELRNSKRIGVLRDFLIHQISQSRF